MDEHKIDITLEHDGTLTLEGIPFHAGDHVEVTIAAAPDADGRRRSLRGTRVRLTDPFTPVAIDDWNAGR